MTNKELEAMYADFERWMPGVFGESSPLTSDGRTMFVASMDPGDDTLRACGTPRVDIFAAALIESAVMDELERRQNIEVTAACRGELWIAVIPSDSDCDVRTFTGLGPTRLHRLHAACRAAFGTEEPK